MSNFENADVTTAVKELNNNPSVIAAKKLTESLITHHGKQVPKNSTESNSEKEKIETTLIELDDEDIIFKDEDVYAKVFLMEKTELEYIVLNTLKNIFADIYGVTLNMTTINGKIKYLFKTMFRYIPDNVYKNDDELKNSNKVRCISSTIEEEDEISKSSYAMKILNLYQQQQQQSYDASRYAKITKRAKEILIPLLFDDMYSDPKKKLNSSNSCIRTECGNGIMGMQSYTNIVAEITLDAPKVLSMLAGTNTKPKSSKFRYVLSPITNNIINTNTMYRIEKINRAAENRIRNKYGAMFE